MQCLIESTSTKGNNDQQLNCDALVHFIDRNNPNSHILPANSLASNNRIGFCKQMHRTKFTICTMCPPFTRPYVEYVIDNHHLADWVWRRISCRFVLFSFFPFYFCVFVFSFTIPDFLIWLTTNPMSCFSLICFWIWTFFTY